MSLSKFVSIHVTAPPEHAFDVFTRRLDDWWPLHRGYTHGGDRAAEIHLEGREGGRFYERFGDGEEYEVGRVLTYDPPRRVVFTWSSPSWQAPTEVEVRFSPEGTGTRVSLEHRGWEGIGPSGPDNAAATARGGARSWTSMPRKPADKTSSADKRRGRSYSSRSITPGQSTARMSCDRCSGWAKP